MPGHADEDAATVLRKIRAARRQPVDARRAIGLELRRPVLVGPLVVPGRDDVARGIGRALRVERDLEAQQHALVHRHDLAWQRRLRAGVAHAAQSREPRRGRSPAEHLEAGEVQLPVGGIHGAVERRKLERAGDAHDGGLRLHAAIVEHHAEELGFVEADVDEPVVERAHARAEQPHLRHRRGVDRSAEST